MYAPTLKEVRVAIRSNNRQQAVEMLHTLIKTSPSADAWYLAAKLTGDPKKKVQYLRTATFMDPKHQASLNYLKELGEKTGGSGRYIVNSLQFTVQEQITQSPILKKFPPILQFLIVVGVAVLFVLMMGFLLSAIISLRGPMITTQQPSVPSVGHLTETSVLERFTAGGLDIVNINQTRDVQSKKDIFRLTILDTYNSGRTLEIFVYDSVKAIIRDQDVLAEYEQSSNVISYGNMFVIYPQDLSSRTNGIITKIIEGFQECGELSC